MTLALLFPGQGSQRPGMLGALPDSPAVAATLTEAGKPADTADALRDTTAVQIALLTAGVACARMLTDEQGVAPDFVAGHSAGAYAAAVTAGVLTFAEALDVLRLRGDLMQAACSDGRWGMAAVMGLPRARIDDVVAQVGTEADPVWLANVNSATQFALSGTNVALERAGDALRAGTVKRLDVPVASHCPLQNPTAARLRERLAGIERRTPAMRFLTNRRGRSVGTADAVLDDLAASVAHTVQWYDATRLMSELGVTRAVEVMPGHVLSRLLPSAAPSIAVRAMEDG